MNTHGKGNGMKVFLAGIIQGSIKEPRIHSQDWRHSIRRILETHLPQAQVYCHYSRHPNSISYDMPRIIETLEEGNCLAGECDLLIAYVPSASMGTAIEMHLAARNGAKVVTISPLQANWVIRAYSHRLLADMNEFETFAASGGLRQLLEHEDPSA